MGFKRKYDEKRYAKYKQVREAVLSFWDNQCIGCGTDQKLQLHHLYYDEVESDYPKNSYSQSTKEKRVAEAFLNPGRFSVLCVSCHERQHWADKENS